MIDINNSSISWGAILAGGFVAAAMTLIVIAFGVGGGLAVVSPWDGQGASASTVLWSAGLFLVAMSVIASTTGGYIAGRLRPAWDDVNEHERFFRDTAHGFVTWAFATTLTATLLAGAATHITAAASAGSIPAAAAGAAQAGNNGGSIYVDRLLRTQNPTGGQAAAAPQGDNAARGELTRLITPATQKGGTFSADDRAYAARIVAQRTGLSEAEAQQRVDQTVAQAKDAADKARSAAMKLSFWLAASLLAGALAASLGAVEGGKLRNSRWYETAAPVRPARVRS